MRCARLLLGLLWVDTKAWTSWGEMQKVFGFQLQKNPGSVGLLGSEGWRTWSQEKVSLGREGRRCPAQPQERD